MEFQPLDEAIFCADFDHQNQQTKPTSAILDQENAIHCIGFRLRICYPSETEGVVSATSVEKTFSGLTNYPGRHPVEKKWLAATQSLDEELAAMTEDQLIAAFSKDYNTTKAGFEQKGYQWREIVTLVWRFHGETINGWADNKDKNPKKAYKKLTEDKQQS